MSVFDKVLSGLILGLLPPLVFMTAAWWGSVPFFPDSDANIALCALIGLTLGITLDFVLVSKYLFRLFELPIWVLLV
ncbi:MAG: hypothetical protein NTV44_06565, partial [Firmicutes bacterium]|nr:hypothetical protein [Bacillota bacterium]